MTLIEAIRTLFRRLKGPVHVQDLYAALPDEHEHSVRARIYERLGKEFKRVGRGLYVAIEGEAACLVVKGDAWEELPKLPSRVFDCLITDPPYGWLEGFVQQGTTRRRMKWSFERREVDRFLAFEFYRVLREGAWAFLFVPAETAATRPHINRMIDTLECCGFVFRKRFVWEKGVNGMGYSGRARHEGILLLTRGRTKRRPCDLGVPDVLSHRAIDPRWRKHPCEKPLGLLGDLIRFATRAGELILDCFAGSCATGLAALGLGRNAVCIEKDPAVLEKALMLAQEGIL